MKAPGKKWDLELRQCEYCAGRYTTTLYKYADGWSHWETYLNFEQALDILVECQRSIREATKWTKCECQYRIKNRRNKEVLPGELFT